MRKVQLGQSGLEVSNLCFGGNVFGWTIDEETSYKILDAFVDGGGNFIDTADVYSRWVLGNQGGESETIIGKWMKLRGNRRKLIVATKVGMEMGPGKQGLKKDYIFTAVEASLKRLQTDYIDLYISHREDEATVPQETSQAYGELIKHGKIRGCGASNYSAKRLTESIHASHLSTSPAYQSLQPLYNLYDRADFENNLRPVCESFKLGVTPYSSLASGFLSGKYRSTKDLADRARAARVSGYLNERGFKILAALDHVSQHLRTTPSAIALAWLINRPTITSAIVSATTLPQMKDLLSMTQIKLDAASLEVLNRASDPAII